MPPHVLVLGGGYVPITLTRQLRGAVARGELDATVVSRDNFHTFHGFVGEMITGRIGPSSMLSPVRRIFAPAKVHVAEIESIDLEARKVVTSRHLDGARFELDYDHLVLCLGSSESLGAYPGLAEHAFKLKTFRDCLQLKNHVLEMFELADIERDPAERRRLLTFVVAGGGYAGTEIAGELADFVRLLTKREYSSIRRDECRVVIVHPGPTLLPELYGSQSTEGQGRGKGYAKLVAYATRHAQELGVELLLDTRVAGATPLDVYLSNGDHVPTRTIISAVGTQAPPLFDTIEIPRDPRGRVRTDACLRVEGFENLWAGGDCASVPHPDGGTCPPVGIYALKHGARIGKNLRRVVREQEPQPFRYPGLGQGVSIGRRTAVGEVKGIPIRGLLCWIVWRSMLFYFFPTWDRRLRLLADWTIWPLVGRDIVQLSRGDHGEYEILHHVYQPGQVIAERVRPVRHVHVIVEGEVELVAGEEIVELLRAGDHFGRKSIELSQADAARARTLVRTVALRADQANELQDMLLSTDRIVARTSAFKTVQPGEIPGASP
ncbi:MAG TPA: FAD-dependent oxidoreductase [Gaiellaceae bacterium]|nr:FAD-dependent oxidoreductase [Gaiellaceae bacterium]